MTSETPARAGTLGRLVVQEARTGRRGEVWWGVSVHGADIKGVPARHAEEEPQDFNDPRWAHRRRARSCQRCGHQVAQERESGVLAARPGASVIGPSPLSPARRLRRGPVVMVGRRLRFESRLGSAY